MDKKSNEDSIKLSKGETKFYKIQCKLILFLFKKKKKEYELQVKIIWFKKLHYN